MIARLALVAALGLVAGSARAQSGGCMIPSDVPQQVFITVLLEANLSFGELPQPVCDSITKKGVSTCRKQVKAAATCLKRAASGDYSIALKQCNQLSDAAERSDCKSSVKSTRDGNFAEIEGDESSALDVCEDEFEISLASACESGPD